MNYNEYDSNGNKKKFNLIDIINDKQKRSRFILLIYLLFFVILVIIVRLNLKSSLNNNQVNNSNNSNTVVENNNTEKKQENVVDNNIVKNEIDEMFSFIESNNYEFKFVINMKNSISVIEGKRYNDKFMFTLENNGSILYFNGTSNYIRAKDSPEGEPKITGFPYVLVNIFDNKIVKEIVNNSKENNELYEISNEAIGNIVKTDLSNKDSMNTIRLTKKNNKITKIEFDFSNAISSYIGDNANANISLEYYNFELVDDFIIE